MRALAAAILLCVCIVAQTISVAQFLLAFFPSKPPLEGNASVASAPGPPPVSYEDSVLSQSLNVSTGLGYNTKYGRVVLMVVDALRSDFVFDNDSPFDHVRKFQEKGQATSYVAKARMPTVTLPRLKALITGGIPGFIDLAFNLDSSELKMDNLIYQFDKLGKRLVHYGDDTWLKMFPREFSRFEGTNSFFVADYTEVDNNVTRHIDSELVAPDWHVLILHYLGVDHIGHLMGPQSPLLPPKLSEMDAIIERITRGCAIADQAHPKRLPTLFVILGDHGMTSAGNHGGNSDLEISTALLFITPSQSTHTNDTDANTKTGDYIFRPSTVDQTDIVPTIAALFGLPIPQESVGIGIQSFLSEHLTRTERLRFAQCNTFQMLRFLHVSNAVVGQKLVELSEAYDRAVVLHAQYLEYVATMAEDTDGSETANRAQNRDGNGNSDRESELFVNILTRYEEIMQTLHEEALQAFTGYVEFDMIRSVCLLTVALVVLVISYASFSAASDKTQNHYTPTDAQPTTHKQASIRTDSGRTRVVSGADIATIELINVQVFVRSALISSGVWLALLLSRSVWSLGVGYAVAQSSLHGFERLSNALKWWDVGDSFDFLSSSMDIAWTWMMLYIIVLLCSVGIGIHRSSDCESIWLVMRRWYRTTNAPLCIAVCVHAMMMFSTSFVEEEHEIIYYTLSTAHTYQAFAVLLEFFKSQQRLQRNHFSRFIPPFALMIATRILRAYNQTGDKWRGSPDMRVWLERDEHAILYAVLVGLSMVCVAGVSNKIDIPSRKSHRNLAHQAALTGKNDMREKGDRSRTAEKNTSSVGMTAITRTHPWSKNLDVCWTIVCLYACLCAFVYHMKSSGLYDKLRLKSLSNGPHNVIDRMVGMMVAGLVDICGWLIGNSIVRIAQIGFFFIASASVIAAMRCILRFQMKPTTSDRLNEGLLAALINDVLCVLVLLALLLHRTHNLPLIPLQLVQFWALRKWASSMMRFRPTLPTVKGDNFEHRLTTMVVFLTFWLGRGAFFQYGNSGKISTIDISGAYTGLSEYGGPVYTGTLTLFITYTGVLMWTLALIPILSWDDDRPSHQKLSFSKRILMAAVTNLCAQTTLMVTISMATFVLRHHLFAWSVMAPRYLYMFAEAILGALTTLLYLACAFASGR
ncbi:hypothetical protein SARC_01552 [Sphaeroforma arctica JP610]|uniref:GPI ethanolamine phosphate transferase 2 C-terminal domain-containing protein n=1 Tax=Sphaeroforma arctica JP610 TaxID=667725 RepID=A0A0L0GBB5_9EUKA|nr:hypothetical protein SARC_01552 [Sphaeroforma arctica JP610]KNC86290.1 hypothetical protein SARC_01552 [Sphaeroforma arctica JP610]|eukprot:XP_014160192.1 hypothetical protein SARC_01552 [Sphaeroforma arctica JP610]